MRTNKENEKLRTKIKFLYLFIVIILILNGVFVGILMTREAFNKVDYKLWEYACNDGCSIATKDTDEFLTNKTFQCWNECNVYISELVKQ